MSTCFSGGNDCPVECAGHAICDFIEVLMGWGDSQVAKHAADMVLADDNFATIGEGKSVIFCVLSRVYCLDCQMSSSHKALLCVMQFRQWRRGGPSTPIPSNSSGIWSAAISAR